MPCHGALESSVTLTVFFLTMNRHEPNGSPCSVVNKVGPAGPADPQEKWPVFYEALSYEPRKLETDWEAANLGRLAAHGPLERPLNHGNMKVLYTPLFSFLQYLTYSNMFRQTQMFPSNHDS